MDQERGSGGCGGGQRGKWGADRATGRGQRPSGLAKTVSADAEADIARASGLKD